MREKIVPISWIPTMVLYAVATPGALTRAKDLNLKVVARIRPEDYRSAVRRHHGEKLRKHITRHLAATKPLLSAHVRLTGLQSAVLAGILLLFLVAPQIWGFREFGFAVSLVASFFFTLVISIRLFCLLPSVVRRRPRPPPLADHVLPTYTVLVPLFRETAVLDQLMIALSRLDYPALCIKRTNLLCWK